MNNIVLLTYQLEKHHMLPYYYMYMILFHLSGLTCRRPSCELDKVKEKND